ncbi:ABC transporter permease [bacterium]|nr:ABC transporter permease [bacterium]
MKVQLYIALKFLRARHRNRFVSLVAVFAIIGIAIGVSALIVSLSVMNGFEGEVRSRIIGTVSHVNVYSLRAESIGDWEPLLETLSQREDVVAAAPFVYGKVPIANDGLFDGIMLRGIIPSREVFIGNPESTLVDGDWLPEIPDSNIPPIALGLYLAQNLSAKPGDTVVIYGLDGARGTRITPKLHRFIVCGIFETGMFDFDAALGYINLESAQRIFDLGESVTGIELRIKNFYEADKIASHIEDDLAFPYYAMSWAEMNKNLFSWMTLEKWGLFLLLSLIIAVAAFNIASTLIMVVMEKTTQIGILRAMGATSKLIGKVFFIQGLMLGVIGTFIGAVIGVVLAFIQNRWEIISLPADIYSISSLPVNMHLLDVTIICIISVLITLLSSIYPALRAAKSNPIEAIRMNT